MTEAAEAPAPRVARTGRLRHRPDHFMYRENDLAFHRIQDGATLGRLDPYAPGEQEWLLHSGRRIRVTAAEIRDITKQVHDLDLPDTRPEGYWNEERIASIESRLDALEAAASKVAPPQPTDEDLLARIEALRTRAEEAEKRAADLEAKPPEVPVQLPQASPQPAEQEGDGEPAIISSEDVDDLLGKTEEDQAEAIRTMKGDRRRRFTELLHAELSELKNLRGMAGEDLNREADIERLLGLFARLGEI